VTLVDDEQRREIAALADRLGLDHGLGHRGARPDSRRPVADGVTPGAAGRRARPRSRSRSRHQRRPSSAA
jgi:hypothetical protein